MKSFPKKSKIYSSMNDHNKVSDSNLTSRVTKGFTLVELAISLVVIGLIVGGILVGQDLVKAAQLRATIKQYEEFNAATNAFKIKYGCLPGDCPYVTKYWPQAASCPSDGGWLAWMGSGTGDEVCDGNGDGVIGSIANVINGNQEKLDFWKHLGLAELIPGKYNGHLSGSIVVNGIVPLAKLGANSAWLPQTNPGGYGAVFDGRNIFTLGGDKDGNMTGTTVPVSDAFGIDTKIDDGTSVSPGVMFCFYLTFLAAPTPGECVYGTAPAVARYNVGDESAYCACALRMN